ncbi:helix-turn-helix domain-containing protein, partial [Acinetobacter nosocomialis]
GICCPRYCLGSLGRIERGEVNPTLEKIYELASALETLPSKLLP